MRPLGGVIAFLLACAAPLAAQSVRGTVVASPGGEPVPAALVVLRDGLGRTVDRGDSDGEGRFTLRAQGPGDFWVGAEHAGYAAPAPVRVTLAAGEPLELRLEVAAAGGARATGTAGPSAGPSSGDTAAVRLEGITVTAEASARVLRLSGFYERQRASGGGGAFLDAQAIAALRRARIVDVINGLRGVNGLPVGTGSRTLGSAQRAYTARRFGARCTLPVYLDGILVPAAELDRLKPEHLAGVEVYVGAETPPRFQPRQTVGQVCGSVVVWTKGGQR